MLLLWKLARSVQVGDLCDDFEFLVSDTSSTKFVVEGCSKRTALLCFLGVTRF